MNITKIIWKLGKLWFFDEVRNVLIEKRHDEGMGEA